MTEPEILRILASIDSRLEKLQENTPQGGGGMNETHLNSRLNSLEKATIATQNVLVELRNEFAESRVTTHQDRVTSLKWTVGTILVIGAPLAAVILNMTSNIATMQQSVKDLTAIVAKAHGIDLG